MPKKRELRVTEASETGLLGGSHNVRFSFHHENNEYSIDLEQYGTRTITISTQKAITTDKLLFIYYRLKTLLLLLDGQFHDIKYAVEDGVDVTASFKKRELPCYESADFMIGRGNFSVPYSKALSPQVLSNWCDIYQNLDISFSMMLYCISSVKMPIDMKCALMVESFIPLSELIDARTLDFTLPEVKGNESKLKKYLVSVIAHYGKDIFGMEYSQGIANFAEILKDSRNRIGHAKSKQGKIVLNGNESMVYLCKLSLLYRVVLLSLIGFPDAWYIDKLKIDVQNLDKHQGIILGFLPKIQVANNQNCISSLDSKV